MDGFIGRESELKRMEGFFQSSKFRSCALVGRRRIGKTTLIERFIENKRHIFFEFLEGPVESNLRLAEEVMSDFKGEHRDYRDFIELFSDLDRVTSTERTVVVFDEFPYVSIRYEPFSSLVKNLIDRGKGRPFIIISGSSVKMMETEISDYSRPLYGRTERMDVEGLSITECKEIYPNMKKTDLLSLYLTTHGSPFYVASLAADSYGDYLERYVIPEQSLFHYEGEVMINRELGDPGRFIDILDALSKGRTDAKAISDYSGMDVTSCKKYIRKLMEIGIIAETIPMAGSKVKPIRYRFIDGMAALYYRVFRNIIGRNASFESLKGQINTVLGRLFEIYCMDLISRAYDVRRIGTWTGKIPVSENGVLLRDENGRHITEESDIDIVAEIVDGKNTIEMFAECKFKSSKSDIKDLFELDRRMEQVHGNGNRRRMLISVGGFTEELKDYAENEGVLLVGMEQIMCEQSMPDL